MTARQALESLMELRPEWEAFYGKCCSYGLERLRSQAWQFRDELKGHGHEYPLEDLEDALMELAPELYPESKAAEGDPRGVLYKVAARSPRSPRAPLATSEALADPDAYQEAYERDLAGFRAWLRESIRGALRRSREPAA